MSSSRTHFDLLQRKCWRKGIPSYSGCWSRLLTFGYFYVLTYCMVQSPSWAANWFAVSQEIPRISRSPKVHYRTHKHPPPVSILGQPNSVHIPTSHLLEIHPNIIHHSTPYIYLLTPRCRVLLEQLTGLQPVKKFPAFHETRRFITALKSVHHLSLSWAHPITYFLQLSFLSVAVVLTLVNYANF